ncbi:MAG: hypothetical protein KatS3mg108_2476 [Isosphaeraceae bacterium]|jgi:hypothetical protein|nr:MAG: hypothetical protein KatS3mg108_2476 [Isosphaeraceae bacterium]
MPAILLALLFPLQQPAPIPNWGIPLDPDQDCTIRLDDSTLSISLPASPHELNAFPKKRNAPRVLRDIESNWTASVRAALSSPTTTNPPAPARTSERSAGLLVWLDEANFFRVARADLQEPNHDMPRAAVLIEYWRDGRIKDRHVVTEGLSFPQPETWLRLTRRIDKMTVEASDDGQTWTELATIPVRLSSRLKFGVVATNTSGAPLVARFSDLAFKNIRLTP